jgi:signal transduction histidine kinase/ActR/RegA family two-component response regulator
LTLTRELESRRRSALAALPAGLVTVDADGTIHLDEVARELVGVDAASITRAQLVELLDPAHEADALLQLEHAARESPPRDVYLPISSFEGTRWLRLRWADVHATGEREGTLLDVTLHEQDRRSLARQLRHNESFARLAARLLEASTLDASIEAIEAEVGHPLELSFSRAWLFGESDLARQELETLLAASGEVIHIHDVRSSSLVPVHLLGGARPVRTFLAAPILIEGTIAGAVVAANEGEPRFLEDDDLAFFASIVALASGALAAQRLGVRHRRIEAKLAQSQKLESLGVLAGGIAHDFNNLLVGILGNAGLVLSALPADAPGRAEMRALRLAALRASDLTKQLLAYAGRAPFEVARVDVRRLVEEMGALLSAAIPKNVSVEYDFHDVPSIVSADPTQLRQVMMNLLTNASDAIGQAEGSVRVSVRLADVDAAYFADALFGEARAPGAYVIVSVTDSGTGMSPEVRARIFDPFFTTKASGRGLGLAAVLGILRAHKSAVKVSSEVGRGTTFEIAIPALHEAAQRVDASDGRDAPDTPDGKQTGTILVIDDEPVVRTVAKRALERAGFDVVLAEDGVEGVATYAERRGEVVAVLLDSSMPRMGGLEALAKIREIDPRVPVVLSSGYSAQDLSGATASAHVRFLPKPFDPKQLVAAIVAAIAPPPSTPRSPRVARGA